MSAVGFDRALALLKYGEAVARTGWNGVFLYRVDAGNYTPHSDIAKKFWGDDELVPYGPYIAMKTADGAVVPWLASQTDILAEDWAVVNIKELKKCLMKN